MSEVRNLVETIDRPKSVVLLSPGAGYNCDQASNNKEVFQVFEIAFKPTGELEVEKDMHDVEGDQIGFLPREPKQESELQIKLCVGTCTTMYPARNFE